MTYTDPKQASREVERIKQAILTEREECARLCEYLSGTGTVTVSAAYECADAIRARGEKA